MSPKQTVYFMALVGALAGLIAWALQAYLADLLPPLAADRHGLLVLLYMTLLGTLVAGLTVAFADHWSVDRFVPRLAAAAAGLGLGAGLLGGLLYQPLFAAVIAPDRGAVGIIGRVATWSITGMLIGLAAGLRWVHVNRLRALHALLGGLAGGTLGGIVFSALGGGEALQALSFMIAGLGITLGVTLVPVLLRDGVLQFVSSGDARAQNKYAYPTRKTWLVQEGDRLTIGSQNPRSSSSMYAHAVPIYVPDARVAPMHAVLIGRDKRFYVQQHASNINPQGYSVYPLLVNQQHVVGTRELNDGDELMLGQTMFHFELRKKARDMAQRR